MSSHVTKWNVNAAGVRQRYQGRNKQQKDIDLFDSAITETLEELHEDGVDAISLDQETFEYATKTQEYLFVDFYASWYAQYRLLQVSSCHLKFFLVFLGPFFLLCVYNFTGVAIASS